ncbi:MAG: hypothetical protein J1F31_00535 [Erysipelotrichales bacterium]|nr:hypothetical protein [Erysipelotrichales bacterium]
MKLVLNGFSGKMGSVVYEYLKQNHEFIGLGDLENKITEDMIKKCDAIIDFSSRDSSLSIFKMATKYHKNMIVGTTGFLDTDLKYFEEKSKEANISLFVVYNFLPSVHHLKKFIDSLDFDKLYITESHHKSKKDKPSGTAKFLLTDLAKEKVEVASIRTDFYCYEHKIEVINEFETIEIVHRCYNKVGYAKGVELALQQLGTFVGLKQNI